MNLSGLKQHHAVLALLGIGAVIVLLYLMRRSAGAPAATQTNAEGQQPYPNAGPIQLGDISIGGSPFNLVYNQAPLPSNTGVKPDAEKKGCCSGGDCTIAGQIVSRNLIPEHVLVGAAQNFAGYVGKFSSGVVPPSSAPASPTQTFVNYYDWGAVNF